MDWHRRYVPTKGYTPIIGPSPDGLKYINFGILRLQDGESYVANSGETEVGLIVVAGKCRLTTDKKEFDQVGRRANFFDGKATSAYIPPQTKYTIEASSDIEVAIGNVRAESGGEVTVIRPDAVVSKILGRGSMRRRVDFLIYELVQASHIIVGETVLISGGWSGFPPHKHDEDNLPVESANEEIYLIKADPPQGFGFLSVYSSGGLDEVYKVKNNDVIAIPRGYHPMVAAPGYKFGFIWFMAGAKRQWKPVTDPDHTWIR